MTEIEKLLPSYYKKSRYIQSICTASDKEFDRLYVRIQLFEYNRYLDTSDENRIHGLEGVFGIVPDKDDTLETRIMRLKAKYRGTLPTTKENLLNAIKIFDETADITEHISDYSFEISTQRPDLLSLIMALVEDVKPAHLAVGYDVSDKEPTKGVTYHGGNMTVLSKMTISFDPTSLEDDTIYSRKYHGGGVAITADTTISMQQYHTYDELKSTTYGDIKGKTYEEILCKEDN